MSISEFIAVSAAIIYVALAVYQHRACWWFYIISSVAYVPVFIDAHLYLYAGMQLFFIAAGIYGVFEWRRARKTLQVVHQRSAAFHVRIIAGGSAATVTLALLLALFVSAADALADSFMSVFSGMTTVLTVWKVQESWLYWMGINIVGAVVSLSKGMEFTALVFLINFCMAVEGSFRWKKELPPAAV